jgi:hypothetical protein
VTRIDPGVLSLFAELRAHERQATEEVEQWKTHHEERKVIADRSQTIGAAMATRTSASHSAYNVQ